LGHQHEPQRKDEAAMKKNTLKFKSLDEDIWLSTNRSLWPSTEQVLLPYLSSDIYSSLNTRSGLEPNLEGSLYHRLEVSIRSIIKEKMKQQ
jgi:hypothetical protein